MNKDVMKQNEVNQNLNVCTENSEQYNINGTVVRVKYKQCGKTLMDLLEEYLYNL